MKFKSRKDSAGERKYEISLKSFRSLTGSSVDSWPDLGLLEARILVRNGFAAREIDPGTSTHETDFGFATSSSPARTVSSIRLL